MKALMVIRNLEYVLENDVNGDDEDELRADAKCKAILQLHVGGALTSVVQRSNSAKQAWDALHEEHLGRAHVRKPRLLAQAKTHLTSADSLCETGSLLPGFTRAMYNWQEEQPMRPQQLSKKQ
jgi:hypothetical protein